MTTFGSQIASHIASVVVTEFKVTPLIKAHHMDILSSFIYKKKEKQTQKPFFISYWPEQLKHMAQVH